MLLVNDVTNITWVRFRKRKSEIITVFHNFTVMLEKYYNIKVFVIYIGFGEFNSNTATKYFNYTGIIWELSIPNTSQQNRIVEHYIQTVVERA